MKPASVLAPIKGIFTRKSDGYAPIPVPNGQDGGRKQHLVDPAQKRRKLMKMSLGALVLVALLYLAVTHGRSSEPKCVRDGSCDGTNRRVWGQYSPWFSAPSEIDPVHGQCKPVFVQMVSRHGARYPTSSRGMIYKALMDKIQTSTTDYAEGFKWLQGFQYKLGADTLTPYGEDEMYGSGRYFFRRYKWLVKEYDPFVRASGDGPGRVLESAKTFTRSIYEAQGRRAQEGYDKILLVREDPKFNNTLTHQNCPAFTNGPASEVMHPKQNEWKETFVPPIAKRLNEKLQGANLTLDDTIALMDQCPYHSFAQKELSTSRFCQLFSPDEWESYNYYQSLDKWYGFGPGNPLGPTQGAGFTNELVARLTGKPVVDNTNTNRTADLSHATFPLNATLYVDFGHDNGMTSIMSALGLFNETEQLPTTSKISAEEANGFSSAWTVPMGARMYIEKLACGAGPKRQEFVRVLVNNRVMPLKVCNGDEFGRCKLNDFIESLSFMRSGAHWQECYE